MKPKTILQRVFDFALAEIDRRSRPVELPVVHPREPEPAPARAEPRKVQPELPSQPALRGLEVVRAADGERLTLRWSIGEQDVARAESLLSGKAVLCLRVVSFSPGRDDVVREVRDRPGVELAGECELSDAPERAVVALGLRTGERFVSISHHVV